MKKYNKLVRDNIPEIIKNNGEEPIVRILSSLEYWYELIKKDQEELIELTEAITQEQIKKELADKLEVIIAMAKYKGISLEEIIKEADEKREKNGSFQKRLFLVDVVNKRE